MQMSQIYLLILYDHPNSFLIFLYNTYHHLAIPSLILKDPFKTKLPQIWKSPKGNAES